MSVHRKQEVVQSLDYVLYCHFVYVYFLDASLLALLLRFLLQLVSSHVVTFVMRTAYSGWSQQLLAPTSLARSLRTALGIISASFVISVLIHLLTEPGRPGILIDFIGNQHAPSLLRLLGLDVIIFVIQLGRILISSSLSAQLLLNSIATTVTMPPTLASTLGVERVQFIVPRESGEETADNLFYQHDMVVDIGFRSSIRNLMYADMDEEPGRSHNVDTLPV